MDYVKISEVLGRIERDSQGHPKNPRAGRRKPGEAATRKDSIRLFCLHCCVWHSAETKRCTAEGCWMYPYRKGTLDKELLENERNENEA